MNGALCTVIAIRVHTTTVKFDGMSQTYPVMRVKARFVVMKNIPTTTSTVIAASSIMPQHVQVYSYLYEQRCNTVVHACIELVPDPQVLRMKEDFVHKARILHSAESACSDCWI